MGPEHQGLQSAHHSGLEGRPGLTRTASWQDLSRQSGAEQGQADGLQPETHRQEARKPEGYRKELGVLESMFKVRADLSPTRRASKGFQFPERARCLVR